MLKHYIENTLTCAPIWCRLVELHNYRSGLSVARGAASPCSVLTPSAVLSSANSALNKLYNWSCLNKRVFRKLGFVLSKAESEAVCTCQLGAVERVLKLLQARPP